MDLRMSKKLQKAAPSVKTGGDKRNPIPAPSTPAEVLEFFRHRAELRRTIETCKADMEKAARELKKADKLMLGIRLPEDK